MAPPHTPGIPGQRLPPHPPAREELAPGALRPRIGSREEIYSDPPASGPEVERDAEQFNQAVHAKYGKGSFSGPAWVFLVLALVAAAVALTWFVTRNSDGSRPPSDTVLNELRAFRAEQDKSNVDTKMQIGFLTNRVGSLESQNSALAAAIAGISATNPRFAPAVNQPMSQALTQPHR